MYLNPVMIERSSAIRIVLHITIALFKLKRKKFRDIHLNIQGIIRELKHTQQQRRFIMPENTKDFDFSLIINDVESSDGQTRHQYFEANETETEEISQK